MTCKGFRYIKPQMPGERIIAIPSSDYVTFRSLERQVGKLDKPIVVEAETGQWYNSDLPSSEMAVRGIVREATLLRLGYQPEEDWIAREENIARSLESNPEAKTILGEPNFMHYQWQDVSCKDLGSFADMQEAANSGPIVDANRGLVFFADEVQQLSEGKIVTTLHSSGFAMGFVAERREAFKVVDGNLLRVRGTIVD